VVLTDGTLVMKDFDRDGGAPATLLLLDPDTLEERGPDVQLDEASIARLSADGDDVYVVGERTVLRLHWDGAALVRDPDWGGAYLETGNSYGWDPVIAGGQLWFLDNGAHDYVTTMLGAGVATGPVHLIRISLSDPADRESVPICGMPRGAVTNPPVYDPERRIAVEWAKGADGTPYTVRLTIQVEDRKGILADVSSKIAGINTNIRNVEATVDDQMGRIDMTVEISDVKHLQKVIKSLRSIAGVVDVERAAR
jgi:predicted amino acid-binding ACT domain protein